MRHGPARLRASFLNPPTPSKDLPRRIPPSGEMDHRPIVGAWPRLEDMRWVQPRGLAGRAGEEEA
jgi:hypothetical protein